jgi:hypothetical protein
VVIAVGHGRGGDWVFGGQKGPSGGVDMGLKCGVIRRDSKADSISKLKLPSTISRLDLKRDGMGWL